jgi:4-hydroxythreonine-4-phosphate dehydrogenase
LSARVHDRPAPLIISMGDPAGIGPEIIAGAWRALKDQSLFDLVVIGDADLMARQGVAVTAIDTLSQSVTPGTLGVLNRPLSANVVPGTSDRAHATHIIGWIAEAVELCLLGEARALITAPINKSVLYAEGFSFPGHTEYLEALTQNAPYSRDPRGAEMMLTAKDAINNKELRVVLATIHLALKAVAGALDAVRLERTIRITHAALKADLGIAAPRIAVAALNPHAGEDGALGTEEIEILRPLITRLQADMDIKGPYPADSLFHQEARARFDAVICMYHDQGLIPLKSLDFWGGVNVTLGLPIIRTSPDHGTGFDIAGKGIARSDSLINAIWAAHDMSLQRAAGAHV